MTTISALLIDDLKASYTFQKYTLIKGEPFYNTISHIKIKTIQNSARSSLPTSPIPW